MRSQCLPNSPFCHKPFRSVEGLKQPRQKCFVINRSTIRAGQDFYLLFKTVCYLYYKYYQSFSMNQNIENNNNNSGLCASRLSGTLGIFKNVCGHLQIWNVNKH